MTEGSDRAGFARIVPKAEIHLHLEGSIDVETLLRIRRARGDDAGPAARERLGGLYRHRDFPHFLRNFGALCSELRRPQDFGQVTASLSARLREEGVRYAEVFCSPQIFTREGLPCDEMLQAIDAAAKEREADGGPRIRLLLDGVRQFGIGGAEELVEMAAACRTYGVVGIGVGGDERALATGAFEPVYREARRLGLRTTIHAGEFDGPRSVWEAMEVLEVERVGHGIRAVEDAVLLRALRAHRLPLECCPTSNIRTGVATSWESHPVRLLHEAGCVVTVGSDDPAMFGTSIASEWRALEARLGFTRQEVLAIGAATARASFADAPFKEELIKAMTRAGAELCP